MVNLCQSPLAFVYAFRYRQVNLLVCNKVVGCLRVYSENQEIYNCFLAIMNTRIKGRGGAINQRIPRWGAKGLDQISNRVEGTLFKYQTCYKTIIG